MPLDPRQTTWTKLMEVVPVEDQYRLHHRKELALPIQNLKQAAQGRRILFDVATWEDLWKPVQTRARRAYGISRRMV